MITQALSVQTGNSEVGQSMDIIVSFWPRLEADNAYLIGIHQSSDLGVSFSQGIVNGSRR